DNRRMADADKISDDQLVERARDGDADAFRKLVERYEGQVAATVIGMVGYGQDAEDVGQEVFIRFFRSLDRFRGDAALGTYLTRIAINQSLKMIRKRKSRLNRFAGSVDDLESRLEPVGDLSAEVEESERQRLVHAALGRLKADHRAVVVLRMLQGYSTNETAELLGVPAGTVMSRLSRALERLEELLAPVIELRTTDATG
ncbi:MAG: sigma-70 family RNA polymerase sigma factor, partial [Rhodothermia bacterium]|nr:sigma-70 family RNA polymerase sigma factor [Rhodothermia bacterium]